MIAVAMLLWLRGRLKFLRTDRACILDRQHRKVRVKYDKRRHKSRNRVEIIFGGLNWLRAATRYDRGPKVFVSATALAAIVIWW